MSELVKTEESTYKVTEFQKHTGITYMSHQFSKKALMCFHVLLYNSYLNRDFQKQKTQSEIKEKTLLTLLQFSGANAITQTKKIIEQVISNPIKYNLLAKDKKNKNSWDKMRVIFTDFDFVTKPGYVIYKYNESFVELMAKPNAYSKFNILTQYDLNQLASIVLHSLLIDHLHTVKTPTTPWIPVPILREIFGIEENSKNYSQKDGFRELRKNYIKKPIHEINEKSNIKIEKEEVKMEGRNAVAVRFVGIEEQPYQPTLFDYKDITSIDEVAFIIANSYSSTNEKQELIIEEKEKDLQKRDILNLQKRLTNECGFSYYYAKKFVSSYDYDIIENSINTISQKIKNGSQISNIAEYTRVVIRNNAKDVETTQNTKTINENEKILSQIKDKPFSINDDDFLQLLKRCNKKNLSHDDIENAIFAVRENIEKGNIKTTPLQQLKMALSQKWQPKESVAKRKDKEKQSSIFRNKHKINELLQYKKKIEEDFEKYLFKKAEEIFLAFPQEEQDLQIHSLVEKWETEEKQKENFSLKFFDTMKRIQFTIQRDKIIKDIQIKEFDNKKTKLFKEYLKLNKIQYNKIDKDIKMIQKEILELEVM